MSRELTPATSLDMLRKEAKRWLKALRAGDPAALARLREAWPGAPAEPGLRHVQHALAREYGCDSWIALRERIDELALAHKSRAERIEILFHHGWDGDPRQARRLLDRDPSLAHESLHLAAMCGNVSEVERRLAADPAGVDVLAGPNGWTPLTCVTYSRLDDSNAVAIARLLLDAGADPNAQFDDGWGSPFKVLTGAIRLGEGARTSHAQVKELVELLVASGASPYDTQALYNVSIVGADLHWYAELWRHSEAAGVTAAWRQPDYFRMKDGTWLSMLDYLLGNAVGQDHVGRAEWLLARGADGGARHAYSGQQLHALAMLSGYRALAGLLETHGAAPVALSGVQAFQAACLGGDEAQARALAAADPKLARNPAPLPKAAEFGNAAAVALLLNLGAPVQAADHVGITALHRAVQSGSLDAVRLLVEAGADVNLRERHWRGTPLSWAAVMRKPEVARYLVPLSRDVRALARLAAFDRLAEVLAAEPRLADEVLRGDPVPTPLFCLPDDDAAALVVARLLLDHGAVPRRKDARGRTAIEAAELRGLDLAAEAMEEALSR